MTNKLKIPCDEYPNCLQITAAALKFHVALQIVPQISLTQTSTRPMLGKGLPTTRTSPLVQGSNIKTSSNHHS